jgi:hypothetical protein
MKSVTNHGWTRELDNKLRDLLADKQTSMADICSLIGKSEPTIRYRVGVSGLTDLFHAKKVQDKTARQQSRIAIKVGNALDETRPDTPMTDLLLEKQVDQLRAQVEKGKQIGRQVYEAVAANINRLHITSVPVPKRHLPARAQDLHGMRSDAHVGETVDKAFVQGVASYDVATYKKRHQRWVEMFLQFYNEDKHIGIDRAVIDWLGDQVTGELIYATQGQHIDIGVVDQLMETVKTEVTGLLMLAREIPQIDIYCVPGNHGMIGGKKSMMHYRSNMDYLFYQIMRDALRNQPNIHIYVSESPTMLVQHGKFNFCLQHGTNFGGSSSGIPFYGMDRVARRLPKLYNMPIHYLLAGHIHQPANIDNGYIITNGSMMGGSDLSVNKMFLASAPTQKIFLFDKNHGLHRETNIYLDEMPQLVADRNNIYTAYNIGGISHEEAPIVPTPVLQLKRTAPPKVSKHTGSKGARRKRGRPGKVSR